MTEEVYTKIETKCISDESLRDLLTLIKLKLS